MIFTTSCDSEFYLLTKGFFNLYRICFLLTSLAIPVGWLHMYTKNVSVTGTYGNLLFIDYNGLDTAGPFLLMVTVTEGCCHPVQERAVCPFVLSFVWQPILIRELGSESCLLTTLVSGNVPPAQIWKYTFLIWCCQGGWHQRKSYHCTSELLRLWEKEVWKAL